MVFEVVDRAEKDLDVKNELLGHAYGIQILPVADLPQHIRDAGSARFLKRRQDTSGGWVNEPWTEGNKRLLTSRFDIPVAPYEFASP